MKLNPRYIERKLKNIKIFSYDCVVSTNKIAKDLAATGEGEGTTVIATSQTGGKGRLGRTFLSLKGGVYFSVILRPKISPDGAIFITIAAAVAAARAIEKISGKKSEIKWVNDIYVDGKKVCGILTESGFGAEQKLNYAVLGVGINLFEPKSGFPVELPLADSVFHKNERYIFKNRYKQRVIVEFLKCFFYFYKNLEKKEFIKEYQQRSFLTGKEISFTKLLCNDNVTIKGTVIGIDDDARLLVKTDDGEEILSHGEIQIVGMEQLLI